MHKTMGWFHFYATFTAAENVSFYLKELGFSPLAGNVPNKSVKRYRANDALAIVYSWEFVEFFSQYRSVAEEMRKNVPRASQLTFLE